MNRAKNTKNSPLRQESCNCSTLACSVQYLRIKSLGLIIDKWRDTNLGVQKVCKGVHCIKMAHLCHLSKVR